MKKILMTLVLLVPALFAGAQGPIKAWNDQLDDFIVSFNEVIPTLNQIYADNGIDAYVFTYFEPESGNVVMEGSIRDDNEFNKVNDELMNQARSVAVNHIASTAKKNSRINSILNEFDKRKTNVVLLYSTMKGDRKQVSATPAEIKSAK